MRYNSSLENQAKILEIVRKIAGKDLPADPAESLFESGVIDSFALPDMVAALEKEFGISVPDGDLNPRKFDSVERISAYIAAHA